VLPSKDSVATEQIKTSLGPKVDLSRCLYRENCTEAASSYIIKSESAGTRTIVNYNELPEMTAEEFTKVADSLGYQARWYHFEGRIPEVSISCIKYLRSQYPTAGISVEVEKPGRPGLEAMASLADVVFFSKSWAQAKGYHTPYQCLDQESYRFNDKCLLCCAWGDQGAVAFRIGELAYETAEAYKVVGASVVDAVGAGDTFIAGMLYGLMCRSDWPLFKILKFSNELAGRKVIQEGFNGLGRQMQYTVESS
jgi:ketohexokinase